MRAVAQQKLIACLFWGIGLGACERTLVVEADPAGTTRLALSGEPGRHGMLTRTLRYGGQEIKAGTTVKVFETWLLRKEEGANPPGYRIPGMYDPSTRTDGLVLPRGSVDVFYVGVPPDQPKLQLPVPAGALRWADGS
jgi:hypothetical protein